ncbi:MAG: L-serine ammonia-lyase [Campylobacterota bacterium]|nr:L-serine ammonia-lyase [Campylobacterota bacterium]
MKQKNYINMSIFDIFKIGPGPSSSHTLGPMKAGNRFRAYVESLDSSVLKNISKLKIELHGSLSATGKGHGTHRAITAGVMGMTPELCNPDEVLELFTKANKIYNIKFKNFSVEFQESDICFCPILDSVNFPFANTLILKLQDSSSNTLVEKEYYSIGGGFITCKDEQEPARGEAKYLYSNFSELREIVERKNISLSQIMVENEMAITGLSFEEIKAKLKSLVDVMLKSVKNGLKSKEEFLPGSLMLRRRAKEVYNSASSKKHIMNKYLIYLNSYALAASEENAAGKIVVTAPTSGSSGLIPAIMYFLKHNMGEKKMAIVEAILAASAVGFVAKTNASIAGAEVGCQGEIGVAAAMGAALMASINKEPIHIVESSATIALEHQLGLTCDPIGGYVQVPCIERNAAGALEGYNSYFLAFSQHKNILSFDEVVQTMLETGRDMNSKYKETAKGGLATIASVRC